MHYVHGEKFMYVIITRGVVTKVTKLNRVNHFRYMIFGGNWNGVIGYGKGKGLDFEDALNKAFKDFKKNLVALDITEDNTFPLEVKTKFTKTRLKIEPIAGFNCWGSPLLSTMIQLCGIHNVRFNNYSRNENKYGLVRHFLSFP